MMLDVAEICDFPDATETTDREQYRTVMTVTNSTFTDAELLAYFDEQLTVERMAAIENALRQSGELRQRVAELARRRDQGVHSVGEVWRRLRLSCPTRTRLGSYLLGALDAAYCDYIRFHIETVGCRYCAANLQDLERSASSSPEVRRRRQNYFQSSAGYLSRNSSENG